MHTAACSLYQNHVYTAYTLDATVQNAAVCIYSMHTECNCIDINVQRQKDQTMAVSKSIEFSSVHPKFGYFSAKTKNLLPRPKRFSKVPNSL